MNADAHFVIGHAHTRGGKPCQDYATAGELPGGGAYAIVADGCSSGGETDVGARVVALSTAQAIKRMAMVASATDLVTLEVVQTQQQLAFDLAGSTLGVTTEDLLATCNYVVYSSKGQYARLHGDGVIAWRFADGGTAMVRFDWADNAPSYPVYAQDGYNRFVAYHGGNPNAFKLTVEYWYSKRNGEFDRFIQENVSLDQAMRGTWVSIPAEVTSIAVFTDGVTQIDGVDWKDCVVKMMNFKTTTGEFAKRRLNRFVADTLKTGRGPIDDLAYAVICFDT